MGTFTLPLRDGNYLLFVADADGELPETDETNNVLAVPVDIDFTPPDLVVESFAVTSGTVARGETIAVEWTVRNRGDGPTGGSWGDRLVLSFDEFYDEDDVQVGYGFQYGTTAPDETYSDSDEVFLSSSAVGAYLLLVVDAGEDLPETDETNNTFAIPVDLPAPDLAVTHAELDTDVAGWDVGSVSLTYTVENQGDAVADPSWTGASRRYDRFYLSTDDLLDDSDVVMNSRSSDVDLAPGDTDGHDGYYLPVPAGTAPGDYYVLVVADADGAIPDIDRTNNTVALPVTVGAGNLALTGASLAHNQYSLGTWDDAWAGTRPVRDTRLIVAEETTLAALTVHQGSTAPASLDLSIERADGTPVGTWAAIRDGSEWSVAPDVVLPAGAYTIRSSSAGGWTASLDSGMGIYRADLLTTRPETRLVAGETIEVTWTVDNTGDRDLASWLYHDILLSADAVLDAEDVWIGGARIDFDGSFPLEAGEQHTGTATLAVPALPGDYRYILVQADDGDRLLETDEADNTIALPITYQAADLTVAPPVVPAGEIAWGQTIEVEWTVTNNGPGPKLFDDIRFVLDADHVRGAEWVDFARGAVLAPGASETFRGFLEILPEDEHDLLLSVRVEVPGDRDCDPNSANDSASSPVTMADRPDLALTGASGPGVGAAGQWIEASWTVDAHGSVPGGVWEDRLYLGETDDCAGPTDQVDSLHGIGFIAEEGATVLGYAAFDTGIDIDQTSDGPGATVEAWVYPRSVYETGHLFSTGERTDSDVYNWCVLRRYGKWVLDNGVRQIDTGLSVRPYQWQHVAAVFDPNVGVSLHVGEESFTVDEIGFAATPETLVIGDNPLRADALVGTVRDVRVWQTVRSKAQILAARDDGSGLTGSEAGLVAWWRMDEGSGTTLVDSSVHGNDVALLSGGGDPAQTRWLERVDTDTLRVTARVQLPDDTPLPNPSTGTNDYFLLPHAHFPAYYETDETNNCPGTANGGAGAVPISITGADLDVTEFTAPPSAVAGETVNVSWRVTNTGTQATDATDWYDAVYLSLDETFDAGNDEWLLSHLLIDDQQPLASGAFYEFAASEVTIPTSAMGDVYLIFVADLYTDQSEGQEANNIASQAIHIDVPDLAMIEESVNAPATGVTGQEITLSWSVENAGAHAAYGPWTDAAWLSHDQEVDAFSDDLLASESVSAGALPLVSGGSYDIEWDVTLHDAAPGPQYILIQVDRFGQQGETDDSNNLLVLPIDVRAPDLTIEEDDVSAPDTVLPGQAFTVNWTVTNAGDCDALADWSDRVYLSQDMEPDPGEDVMLANWDAGDQSPFMGLTDYDASVSCTLPHDWAHPEAYLIVITDYWGHQPETDENNNARAVPIEIVLPDLELSWATAPTQAAVRETIDVSWRVTNLRGEVGAQAWNDVVYLSEDSVWEDDDDHHLATIEIEPATPLVGHYDRHESIRLPDVAPGTYHLFLRTDAPERFSSETHVGESDETNNLRYVGPIILSVPDLEPAALSAPTAAAPRQAVSIGWTVHNNSADTSAAADWNDAFYFSPDPHYDPDDDRLVGDCYSGWQDGPLAPGESRTTTKSFELPDVSIGTWYLILIVDAHSEQRETDETNNILISDPITVNVPNLTATATAPDTVVVQQTVTVDWTVTNEGPGAGAAQWRDALWLSADAELTGDDVMLGWQYGEAPLAAAQAYTRSRDVTLPANATDYAFLLVEIDASGDQVEGDEDDNLVALPVTVTEPPDLQITTASAPADAAVRQRITVSWAVENTGVSTAYRDWEDAIYLCDSPTFDGTEEELRDASISAQTPLAQDASYALSREFRLPGDRTGELYLIVMTDADDEQAETDNTNNTFALPITIAEPDLHITDAIVPAALNWDEMVTFQWTVANSGDDAAADNWRERIYLSVNDTFEPDQDVQVVSDWVTDGVPLAEGDELTLQATGRIPSMGDAETVYVLFISDADGDLQETDESNNVYAVATVIGAPDLAVTHAAVTGATGVPVLSWGERIPLEWTVQNLGAGDATNDWWDMVFLSEQPWWESGDKVLYSLHRRNSTPLVNDGEGYTVAKPARNVKSIPSWVGVGTRYLLFRTDAYGSQAETDDEGANNVFVIEVEVRAPDLQIDSALTDIPQSGVSGQQLDLTWAVHNPDPYDALGTAFYSWYDAVYLSVDAMLDDGDERLLHVKRDADLAPGEAYTRTETVTLPGGLTEPHYLILKTAAYGSQPESDEANNLFVHELALTSPNLTLGGITVPDSIANGELLTVDYTVTNTGGATAPAGWTERLILSGDEYFGDFGDVTFGLVEHDAPLEPGGVVQHTAQVQVPWRLLGDCTLRIDLDTWNQIPESDEADNRSDEPIEVTYATPPTDLVVETVGVADSAETGVDIEVRWRVANHGTATTPESEWRDAVHLSTDAALDDDDVLLGTFTHQGNLDSEDSYGVVTDVTLPYDMAAGTFTILVVADSDGQVVEPAAEDNNVTASVGTLTVTLADVPDLVVDSVTPHSSLLSGGTVDVSWTVRNAGDAPATAPWTDRVYLSTDGTVAGATLVAEFARDLPLEPTLTYAHTETLGIPVLPAGEYVWLVVADAADAVFERDGDANNGTASPSTDLLEANLVPESPSTVADAQSGTTITVNWTVRNAGTGRTPGSTWVDRVYLSEDDAHSADDPLLGVYMRAAPLMPGAAYSPSLDVVLPNGIDGTYCVIVEANADKGAVEGAGRQADNRTATAPFAVTLAPYADLAVSSVDCQELVIGDPADLTVSWTVTNQGTGTGPAEAWIDRIILSDDETLGDHDDEVIAEVAHEGALPVGFDYTETRHIELDYGFDGEYVLFVVADAADAVYEHDDPSANTGSPGHPVGIATRPYADLVPQAVVAPDTVTTGQEFLLSWTIANEGIGPTSTTHWTDSVYIADNPDGQGRRRVDSYSRVGSLAAGASYTRTVRITLPVDEDVEVATTEDRFFFVRTGGPYEFVHQGNNTAGSGAVPVTYTVAPRTDLQAISVTAAESAVDGETIDVEWTVINHGPDDASGEWQDRICLAPGGDRDEAIPLDTFTLQQAVPAGQSYTRREAFRLPKHLSGVFEVYVETDRREWLIDPDRSNNAAGGSEITIQLQDRPDLQVTDMAIPATVTAGGVEIGRAHV